MITENLPTLKIHKLTQKQYEREFKAGKLDEQALYITPDKCFSFSNEAKNILYDNSNSNLNVPNVQEAIDKIGSSYLLLTGGTLSGALTANETIASIRSGTEQPYLKVENSLRNGGVMISNSGRFGLWDNSNNKWLIYNDENGLNKFGNSIWESTLAWRLGDGTEASGYVALRRMGSTGAYTVGLPYTDADGNTTYHNLINADGSRAWVAKSGDTITGNLTVNGAYTGKMSSSGFRSYNDSGMKFNQYGNIQSLSSDTANTWEILNYSGTTTFRVRYSDGFVTANGGFHVSTSSYEAGRIELAGASPYIDFHSQNSTTDYTSRIMDVGSGLLRIQSTTHVALQANGYALYWGQGIDNSTLTSLTPRTTAGAAYDNKSVLGAASCRWMQIYCGKSSLSTSDERDKNIFELDNRYKNLFMELKPVAFTFKDDNTNDVHIGIGAQTTEASAIECGLTSKEIGFISHDYWKTPNEDGRTDRYSVAYDEIAMLAVPFVQSHEKEIQSLKEEIAELKAIIKELNNN